MTEEDIGAVLGACVKIAREFDMDMFVTTSRRTPERIERLVGEKLKDEERCKLLIIANRANRENAVAGILGLSKCLVVSGESISMVSEVAQAGKYSVVFRLKKKSGKRTRHEDFLDNLSRKDCIILTDPADVYENIKDALSEQIKTKKPQDEKIVYNAVARLI
jgi:mitochondrial fission protein ELM1